MNWSHFATSPKTKWAFYVLLHWRFVLMLIRVDMDPSYWSTFCKMTSTPVWRTLLFKKEERPSQKVAAPILHPNVAPNTNRNYSKLHKKHRKFRVPQHSSRRFRTQIICPGVKISIWCPNEMLSSCSQESSKLLWKLLKHFGIDRDSQQQIPGTAISIYGHMQGTHHMGRILVNKSVSNRKSPQSSVMWFVLKPWGTGTGAI